MRLICDANPAGPLTWDESWRLRDAELVVATERSTRTLSLRTDGRGYWRYGDGRPINELDGCGSGFRAELPLDEDGIVLDYPNLFRRVTQ